MTNSPTMKTYNCCQRIIILLGNWIEVTVVKYDNIGITIRLGVTKIQY